MGVATATVISKAVNLIIVAAMGAVLIKAKQSPEREQPRRILAQIVKIGFPSAFETALYNVAMTFIVRFMNQMDTDGMNVTARSYAMQIANFSYCVGAALAQANAIMTGWRIGAKKYEECDRGTRKAVIYGLVTATCFSVTFAITGRFIVHIFTNDIQMIELVVKLLVVDIFLEFGRVTNLVYGQALKTSGDAIFPVIMGAIFMYLFAVGGTYFLGIHMGLLAVGAYIAMAGDILTSRMRTERSPRNIAFPQHRAHLYALGARKEFENQRIFVYIKCSASPMDFPECKYDHQAADFQDGAIWGVIWLADK